MSPIAKQMSCAEVVALVTDYLEGELSWRERRRFRRHLEGCDGCTTYLAQMERVIETLGHLPQGAIPPPALDRLIVAFRDFHRA
jgi:anti-sigma factor (TIGR02949 family)